MSRPAAPRREPHTDAIASCADDGGGLPSGARRWHGWAIAGAIALAAYAAQRLPFAPFQVIGETGEVRHPVGPAIVAIVLGVAIRNLLHVPQPVTLGGRSLVKWSIPWAIVLIGAGLNLMVVAAIGGPSLLVVMGAIVIAMLAAVLAGRLLRLNGKMSLLLAAGTAICGNSAILALAPIIKSREHDMLVSIAVVNLIGLAFMVALPAIGAAAAMSPEAMGVWAGASIHSVPQAVAAGFAYPVPGAGEVATLVKLVRVAMLVPLVVLVTLIVANGGGGLRSVNLRSLVPWFIWGFLALATANTFLHATDVLAENLATMLRSAMGWLNFLGGVLLTVSLGAIGLDVDLRQLTQVGKSALAAGLIASIAMAAACFAMIVVLL